MALYRNMMKYDEICIIYNNIYIYYCHYYYIITTITSIVTIINIYIYKEIILSFQWLIDTICHISKCNLM